MSKNTCPRCWGFIPNNMTPGAYAGAMSRATVGRDIEICSPCGSDEAAWEAEYGAVHPVASWPLPGPRRGGGDAA